MGSTENRLTANQLVDLWDFVPVILWVASADGDVLAANTAWSRATGQSAEDVHGEGWLAAVWSEDRDSCREVWNRAVLSGHPVEFECRLQAAITRIPRWFAFSASPVRGPTGEIRGWHATWTDIHARKIAEMNAELLGRRLDEFEKRVNDFLSVLGHELRNPLAALVSGLDLLGRTRDDDARFEWTVGMMRERTNRLASVLDDLLHLVHILSGRPELERESFRLGRLVEGAIAETIRFFETRGQTLRCHISAELELFADPTRLEQVLVQLLSTASRFAREGGTVELRASRDDTGTAAVLTVRADGTELADSHQEQIFDPLLRSPGERSSKEDVALGLGLAVAKRVSELHGGEIEFRAGPDGKGSEFVVRIPLGDRPKAGDEPTIASPLVSPLGSS
ncbi:MAG TPA: PAS domain-containing sensor histidine kinase, partial [Planctomycetota bacterium]|nr:PAS domain-containing sensor histidine kinase [Planctomycetota bacterium]